MKQELFKEMYNEIQMDGQQKDRILGRIKKEENKIKPKSHIPSFAIVCTCVVFLAGVPVLAANTGLTEKIMQAFNLLNIEEQEITEEQKNIYLKYGDILDNEIELGYGTIKLEAVICDKSYICVPFSFQMAGNTDSTEDITNKNSPYQKIQREIISFSLADSTKNMDMFTVLPPDIHEDGTLKGCFLAGVKEEIKKGDKILVTRQKDWKDATQEKPVAKFKIGKIAESHNIPLDKEIAGQNNIEISPLSLRIEGSNNGNAFIKYLPDGFDGIIVKLKDGSVVQQASTGSWGMKDEDNSYAKALLFASPVNLDYVEGIYFQNNGEELRLDF